MNFKISLIIFGFVISASISMFYFQTRNTHLQLAKAEQVNRAELITKKLDEFVSTSDVIGRVMQTVLANQVLTEKQIEQLLKNSIEASPKDLIYGMGIWFEPFSFNQKRMLFGPYIHWDKNYEAVLTYEWDTEKYYYPNQDWYKAGMKSPSGSVFTEPYIDAGLVYVTNARKFEAKDAKGRGMITVDLVLPQLQKLIDQAHQSEREIIYITNRLGYLLAHPKWTEFEDKGNADSSILNYKPRDLNAFFKLNVDDWIRTEIRQKQLGWTVTLLTEESFLLNNLSELKKISIAAFVFLWGMIVIVWNVVTIRQSEKSEHEKKLEVGRMQLLQSSKMAALGEMSSAMAHEINNPLTIIVGKSRQIEKLLSERNMYDETVKGHLDKINKTVDRISKIIQGLRSFSRSGENDPMRSESVNKIIQETIILCNEKFKLNGVEIKFSPAFDVFISCRATQLSQVFLNLLNNSYDAIQSQPQKWIQISVEKKSDGKMMIISFTDSGAGIDVEIQPRMMQPFFTTKEIGKGTGLGLSISKGIVEDHLGNFYYDQEKKNTTFIIELPL